MEIVSKAVRAWGQVTGKDADGPGYRHRLILAQALIALSTCRIVDPSRRRFTLLNVAPASVEPVNSVHPICR
jgi:hypothetical protein